MDGIKELLSNIFLFSGAPDAVKSLSGISPVFYPKGAEISGKENFCHSLGIVISGVCKSAPLGSGGVVLNTFSAGMVFDAAAVFCEDNADISRITAVTDCEILFISKEHLISLFEQYPKIAVNYITFLSSKILFLNNKISIFTEVDGENKLYRYFSEHCDDNGNISLPMSMSMLAKTLNMGRTSLYREIERLEKKRIIKKIEGDYKLL